ncbi:MAG TPA: hypothetical protein VH518_08930 [Tepidisphaeraceae bacterium]|jgi:hypothetical protein
MKRVAWFVMLGLTLLPSLVQACPMCKDSIPNSDAQQAAGLPGGFNVSVYYMLIGLFVTIGISTTVIMKGVRSTNERMVVPHEDEPRS